MKNIEGKIMAEEEIKQLQNKSPLISQQKQEERKKRDRRIYDKGAVFESIFTESKDIESYQYLKEKRITSLSELKETFRSYK